MVVIKYFMQMMFSFKASTVSCRIEFLSIMEEDAELDREVTAEVTPVSLLHH